MASLAHGFTAKQSADREAIQSRLQLSLLPDLDRVGMTQPVQLLVGIDHGLADPGAIGSATRGGAGSNDFIKGAIDGNIEWGSADNLLQCPPHMELVGTDHPAGIR